MRRLKVSSILLVALLLAACAPKGMDQESRQLYTANQIATRVARLQKTAIAAEAAKGITTDQARVIVTFSVAAQKTLQASPGGWYATVSRAWTETKAAVPAEVIAKSAELQTAWAIVDALIVAYGEEVQR